MGKMTQEEFDAIVAAKAAELVAAKKAEEKSIEIEDVKETKGFDAEEIASAIKKGMSDVVEDIKKTLKVDKSVEVGKSEVEKDKKGGFKSISHFAAAVAKATKSQFRVIPKELEEWDKFTKAAGSPSQNESSSEAGGYLIPEEFRNDILVSVMQEDTILSRTTKVPMASNHIKIPVVNGYDESGNTVWGGIQWKWTAEEGTRTATAMKTARIEMNLHKVAGLAYASDELIEDSPVSMEGLLQRAFADGLKFELNRVSMSGTGASQPLGILNAPCKVAVAKETGQAAATILFENIVKMYSHINDMGNAVWMANPDTLPQLVTLNLAIGTGGSAVFLPANGISGKPYNTLFGLPLIFSKHCKTLGTEGDIVLVDWSQYLTGLKAGNDFGAKFDTSMHVRWENDQTAFKWTLRIDGQPYWPTYITPPNGTNYISPVVTLATRS